MGTSRSSDSKMSLRHFMTVALGATLIIASQSDAAFFQRSNKSESETKSTSGSKFQLQLSNSNSDATKVKQVKELTFSARFHLSKGSRKGVLILKAQMPRGSYIYSVTQKGSPPPSRIQVTPSDQFRISGKFSSDRHPKVIKKDPIFNNRLEKHTQLVQFFVPIEIADGVDSVAVKPEIVFNGQVCSDKGTCMPIRNRRIHAQFAGYFEQQTKQPADSQNYRR